jgi:predicted DNA-binding protein (MmcQ/YjbR family)
VARLKAHCLSYDGAWEDHPWDHTVFKVGKKMFASVGDCVTVKSTLEKQSALIMLPNVEVAAYVGRYGWVTITIETDEDVELAEELIRESYESVRPKKMSASKAK